MTQPKIRVDALDTGSGANKVVATDGSGNVSITGTLTATGGLTGVDVPAKVAYLYGQALATTTGLTFGYEGGTLLVNGVLTTIAAGTVVLTASSTNYVEATTAGVVSANTTGFTAGRIPLHVVVTSGSAITSVTDSRVTNPMSQGVLSKSVAGGTNVTLTAAEARNDIITFTGVLTGNIDVIIPATARTYQMYNNTTGAFTLRVKTSGGTGYYLQQGMNTDLVCDGTNTVLADTATNSFDGAYGWQDLRGNFIGSRLGTGGSAPTWTAVQGTVFGYTFGATGSDEVWVTFHVPHDYVPGTVIYIHMHWAPTNTNTGVVRWGIEYTLAKGYSQATFPATTTVYLQQAGSGTALQHQIVETSIGDAIPATNLEPDALILCRVFRDGGNGADTYNASAFGFECDLHYQSTLNRTTKNRNFPFS